MQNVQVFHQLWISPVFAVLSRKRNELLEVGFGVAGVQKSSAVSKVYGVLVEFRALLIVLETPKGGLDPNRRRRQRS